MKNDEHSLVQSMNMDEPQYLVVSCCVPCCQGWSSDVVGQAKAWLDCGSCG